MPRSRARSALLRASIAVAVVLVAALVASSCASNAVSVDVDGVDARWVPVPGPGHRRALVVTGSDDEGRPRRTRPLFVVLHGAGQDALEMTTYGGWAAAARDQHAVAAFAEGLDHSFNAGTCCGTSALRQVDDVGYLDRLITTVTTRVGADPSKVYMVGFSNGAMMVYRYLCEGATKLQGAASLAGTNVAGCTPTRPTTFLQVSGTRDDIVPIGDTPSVAVAKLGPLVPVDDSVRRITEAWSCPASRRTTADSVITRTWSPCADGVAVRFDVVIGLVHMYPFNGTYSATGQALAMWGFG